MYHGTVPPRTVRTRACLLLCLCLHACLAVFSTQTNRMEVDIEAVEVKHSELERVRKSGQYLRLLWLLLVRRSAFMATPPIVWVFLVVLGLFSSLSLYVRRGASVLQRFVVQPPSLPPSLPHCPCP
jgi:hypothetical protein